MTTLLPKDADNNPIQALRLKSGAAHSVAATTAASTRNVTAFDPTTKIVSLYATGAVFLNFGDSTVTAGTTDHYFPQGVYYDYAVSSGDGKGAHASYVSVRAATANCTVYISEKE